MGTGFLHAIMPAPSNKVTQIAASNPSDRALKWLWQVKALPDATLPPEGEGKLLTIALTGQVSKDRDAKTYQLEPPRAVTVRI
jgi:hypothetical protein